VARSAILVSANLVQIIDRQTQIDFSAACVRGVVHFPSVNPVGTLDLTPAVEAHATEFLRSGSGSLQLSVRRHALPEAFVDVGDPPDFTTVA